MVSRQINIIPKYRMDHRYKLLEWIFHAFVFIIQTTSAFVAPYCTAWLSAYDHHQRNDIYHIVIWYNTYQVYK